MTDRVQPGAIDSIVRNDELAEIFAQYSDGYIIGDPPTTAAVRRLNFDETAVSSGFNKFDIGFGASSGAVDIAPGEAFIAGYCARDSPTEVSLPASETSTIVLGWDLDAIFDPQTDANRDAADEVIIDIQSNVDPQYPTIPLFDVETLSTGDVASTTDRRQIRPAIDADIINATNITATSVTATDNVVTSTLNADLIEAETSSDSLDINARDITARDLSGRDITLTGNLSATKSNTVNNFGIVSVPTRAELPAPEKPQIAFIENVSEYTRVVDGVPFSIQNLTQEQSSGSDPPRSSDVGSFAFNNDGTKLFEIVDDDPDDFSADLISFNLSNAFDLTSASFIQRVNAQDERGVGITFNNDGTKLYQAFSNNTIHEVNLGSPFDISTRNSQATISADVFALAGVELADDGTKLYEGGFNQITQKTLGTPDDINTVQSSSTISFNDGDGLETITFNSDGTRAFGINDRQIVELQLPTPFDISSAVFVKLDGNTLTGATQDIAVKQNDTKLFEVDRGTFTRGSIVGTDFGSF